MDELGQPRKTENGKWINLDTRINNLEEKYIDIKKHLLAIKWLGNVGSHGADGLKIDDTLQAYTMINYVIDNLYKPKEDFTSLNIMADTIVAAKGPVNCSNSIDL